LACLVCSAHGRWVQASSGNWERQASSQSDPLRALSTLLVAARPEASFNPTAPGLRFSPGLSRGDGTHTASGPIAFGRPTRKHQRLLDTMMQGFAPKDGQNQMTEREETFEFGKDFVKISAQTFLAYYLLTTYAGLEPQQASPLILAVLLGYAAYLFWFDDGSTYSGLMWQGYKNLADEEGFVLFSVPRLQGLKIWDGPQAAGADSDGIAKEVISTGFARVNNVLSLETAKGLRENINAFFDKKVEAAKTDMVVETRYFNKILYPDRRWDYKLDFEPPVRKALEEALEKLKPAVAKVVGEDAVLFSMAALVNDPGSPRQPMYFDKGAFADVPDPSVVTVAIPLQDTANETGLGYIPTTNTFEMHTMFQNPDDGQRQRIAIYRSTPMYHEKMSAGDATLRDARTLYFDSDNEVDQFGKGGERRIYFYFSFRRRTRILSSGSMMTKFSVYDCRLDNLEEWLPEDSPLTEIEEIRESILKA